MKRKIKILNQLKKVKDELDEIIDAREFVFDERSEKWQDSEKGQNFEKETSLWQEVFNNLDMTIDSLDEL